MKATEATGKKYRLAVLTSHPIQYQVPLWRKLAEHPKIELMVYFCSDYGVTEKFDPGFGVKFKWDIPLLEGYRYKFLKNCSSKSSPTGFCGVVNPGIVKELWTNRYDALFVHSYAYTTHVLAALIARLRGIKILVRSELNLLVKCSLGRHFLKRLLLPSFFRFVDSFMAIGRANWEYYEHYRAPKEKIHLMPYAVDNESFFAQSRLHLPDREKLVQELGICPDTRIVLYVAKFLKRKRPLDLIRAFERLELPDTALVMVGDGEERNLCHQYVKEQEVNGVHFVGFKNQSELPKFYSIAHVFVLPSEDEPWGLVINEAMCFGLPIIATEQVGAAHDLIKQGMNGFTYPAGNVEALRDHLKAVLMDDAARQKMGKASVELIEIWGFKENVRAIVAAIRKNRGVLYDD